MDNHRTSQSIILQMIYSVPRAGVILRKQEVCCAPCKQTNFRRTPDQLKLAGIAELARSKPCSERGQLEQDAPGHGQLLSPDTQAGDGGINRAR